MLVSGTFPLFGCCLQASCDFVSKCCPVRFSHTPRRRCAGKLMSLSASIGKRSINSEVSWPHQATVRSLTLTHRTHKPTKTAGQQLSSSSRVRRCILKRPRSKQTTSGWSLKSFGVYASGIVFFFFGVVHSTAVTVTSRGDAVLWNLFKFFTKGHSDASLGFGGERSNVTAAVSR